MRLFECQNCGNPLHFDNRSCNSCGTRLGYLPEAHTLSAVEPAGQAFRALAAPDTPVLFCANAEHDVCNWLVPAATGGLCACCRHTKTIPDLSVDGNLDRWRQLEAAKRHLFYSLMRFDLPTPMPEEDSQHGLTFDFLADTTARDGKVETVLTGHDDGHITLNIAEADDAEREKRRSAMGEPYRTLVGHFRHEIGHYYWDMLVRDGGRLEECRAVFGDEQADYAAALQERYQNGPRPDWQTRFISAYASVHPWEDFAETWAHYFHMVDGLETARSYGLELHPRLRRSEALEVAVDFQPYKAANAGALLDAFVPFTVAMNSVNRSIGQPDFYPFVMSQPVMDKLGFIHRLIHERPGKAA